MLREMDTSESEAPPGDSSLASVVVAEAPAPEDKTKPKAQRRKRPLLVADLFCGAGGSSTGARKALRRLGYEMTLTCVNHWPVAIETHQRNHRDARHYCQDVSTLRPLAAVPEGYLDLLMASPTCTYHSRARGGRPTSDQQRMDPWHVITWLTELRVRCLLIENVPEFQEWGPVDKRTGRPMKSRKGEYFQQWVKTIKALGFKVDWKVLNCADHGDATTRQRFFLMARSDKKPLRWPEPTHSKEGGRDLLGERQKWRAARQIIDWQRPGRSIFGRKKPLAPKTLARVMAGAKKFGWPEPFLVILRQHMDGRSVDAPLPSIAAGGTHIGVAEQVLEPFVFGNRENNTGKPLDGPLPGMTTSTGGGIAFVDPSLTPLVLGQQSGATARPADEPLPTISTGGAISVTEPVLIAVTGGDKPKAPKSVDEPLGTITTHNGIGMTEAFMFPVNQGSDRLRGHRSVNEPFPTILTRESLGVATPMISPYYGSGSGETCKSVEQPLDSITTKARFGMVEPVAEPFVISPRHGKEGAGPAPRSAESPLPTITAGGSQMGVVEAVAEPFLVPNFGERPGQQPRNHSVDAPLPAVTSHGAGGLVEPCLITVAHGEWPDPNSAARRAHSIDAPVPGITASGRQVGVVEPVLLAMTDQQSSTGGVRSVDDPTFTAVTKQNQAVVEPVLELIASDAALAEAAAQGRLVMIDGRPHLLDIRFRMLEPYELARAMGFSDEEAEYEFAGTKTEITKQIGNAVPVSTACALVSALMTA